MSKDSFNYTFIYHYYACRLFVYIMNHGYMNITIRITLHIGFRMLCVVYECVSQTNKYIISIVNKQ